MAFKASLANVYHFAVGVVYEFLGLSHDILKIEDTIQASQLGECRGLLLLGRRLAARHIGGERM